MAEEPVTLVPLYGFVAGDTLGVLLLVHDGDTIREVGRVAQQAAAVRVAPRPHVDVLARGTVLDPRATVSSAGLAALDRIDIVAGER